MRSLLLVVLTGSAMTAAPAFAEEPLFLRIRPNGDRPASIGTAWSTADDAMVARARALREAVWARSDRRARIAIASVCTGCLKPLAPFEGRATAKADVAVTGSIPEPPPSSPTAGDP